MTLDEVKERIWAEWQALSAKVQDTTAFQNLKEKFGSLSPQVQKLLQVAALGGILFFVLSIPFGNWMTGSENIEAFEEKRQLIRQVFSLTKEMQSLTPLPRPPEFTELKSQFEKALLDADLGESQIEKIEMSTQNSSLPANWVESVVDIRLSSLNIRQVSDLGHLLQGLNPSVRLQDMEVQAGKEPGYFQVLYRMAILKVPDVQLNQEETSPPARSR